LSPIEIITTKTPHRVQTSDTKKEIHQAVKKEIKNAFSENRSFPFYSDKTIINGIRSGKPKEDYFHQFVTIKNHIIDSIASDDSTIRNILRNDTHLSNYLISTLGFTHKALAEIDNPNLYSRRFVVIREKSQVPCLYFKSGTEALISHVGKGPGWKEIPTIYLSRRIFEVLTREQKRGEKTLFEIFKSLLLVEERAIETGYSYVEPLSAELTTSLEILVKEVLTIARFPEVEVEVPEKKIVRRFTPKKREFLLKMLDARLPSSEFDFDYRRCLEAVILLGKLARRFKKVGDYESLREVVRLLVPASGHDIHEVRNRANVILERVFSPKEFDAPPATRFINIPVGSKYQFKFKLPRGRSKYFVRLYFNRSREGLSLEKDISFIDLDLFYDSNEGLFTSTYMFDKLNHYDFLVFRGKKRGTHWLRGTGFSGRINVIPDLKGELILEIFPDIHGHTRAYWGDKEHPGLVYNENGEVIRTGKFSDITSHLEDLKKKYSISAIYLLGVQKRGSNREDWAPEATSPSPFAPMSLTEIEPSLGGEKEFLKLVKKTHELEIKVIIDVVPHLNRKSMELPDRYIVKCYDNTGNLVPRAATDGQYGKWNDGKLLNYRIFDVWEWMAKSICTLIQKYDIDGIRFDSAHAVPIMMKKNNYSWVYGKKRTHEDMVEGTIIVNDREDDHFITTSYYDSSCRERIACPFHYYLALSIQQKLNQVKKDFFIYIAECYWGRERYLSRTGIIPYNSALFKICENIIHGRTDVREIYHLYDNYFPKDLPEGTDFLGILGNHDEHRILNTFGPRALKAAAMLTSFMHNIIMDYEGSAEGEGWKVYLDNIYVNWNQFEYASNRAFEHFYRYLYSFHKSHQGKGYLVWSNNIMVASALKFTQEDIWLGVFNFSDMNQNVSVQFDLPLLPLKETEYYKVIDPTYSYLTGHYNYYTGRELRTSRINTIVTYTDRIKLLKLERVRDISIFYHEFLKDSFYRMCALNDSTHFLSNFAFQELVSHFENSESFSTFIQEYLFPIFGNSEKSLLQLGLKRALFHMFVNGIKSGVEILQYVELLNNHPSEDMKELARYLVLLNKRGAFVFLSAEAEPFSKCGGLANVVYELPRELVKMGEEVYVITPFYHHGDRKAQEKMEKAVKKYRIAYTGRNVKFFIQENEYEVGVHYGVVKGVNYFLLDHHEFFDGLYWGYTAEEKLRKRIGFARVCAEVVRTFDLHPLFTFTNDAFSGIFNGIVKSDSFYAQSPNFKETTFIHIIHNGGWQYFDSYFRYEKGFDHFNLFNLPHWLAGKFLDPVDQEKINCMASGVRFADSVITVSPSYARQIEKSCDGMEHILHHVIGINNAVGKDFIKRVTEQFNESGFIETNYPLFLKRIKKDLNLYLKIKQKYPELLEGPNYCETLNSKVRRETLIRVRNKLLLQIERGLTVDPDRVLFTMIHRIVEQKGFQLLLEASEGIFKNLGFQGIVGGSVSPGDQKGDELIHGLLNLKNYYPESISVNIGFQDISIPLLASDVFLMPSMSEPGGISQLEAMACGCLVVARATGGLIDTVHPLTLKGFVVSGNGFLFTDYNPSSFYDAMERCMQFFRKANPMVIHRARINARRSVYYWDKTAREYIRELCDIKELIRLI